MHAGTRPTSGVTGERLRGKTRHGLRALPGSRLAEETFAPTDTRNSISQSILIFNSV